ncbi:hypothetical protein KLF50_14870 (plasmid) [Clostridium perfringens]|uniref:hypothetical protein n=1 Tax=Clostridium perfringens TaxID=1502 RepID=UPI001CCBD1C6|nr:hypothetical protein [Clostridium perfringens]UBK83446.1 hypothetical protein KLF50_14870 [Clostridium perfringens]
MEFNQYLRCPFCDGKIRMCKHEDLFSDMWIEPRCEKCGTAFKLSMKRDDYIQLVISTV